MQNIKQYKIFSISFAVILGIVVGGGFLIMALLYAYDAFWLFHKPIFRAATYHSDMRIQAKGLIDNVHFDSVILGSSMLENANAKEAEQALGGAWINLSMSGAHPNERAVVLEYLLKVKPPKHILYSLDTHSMILDRALKPSIKAQIYKNDFVSKISIYLNKKWILCALKWSKKPECVGNESKKIPTSFYAKCQKELGFLNWCQTKKVSKFLRKADKIYEVEAFNGSILESQELISKYILDFARNNKNVNFHLAISAYSTFYYRVRIDDSYTPNPKTHFDKWKKILIWLVNESAKMPNVKIYGFDDLSLTNDTNNYIDQGHYKIDKPLNSIAIMAIRDKKHILTPNNVERYLLAMENKIKNYDIAPLLKQLESYEKSHNKRQ